MDNFTARARKGVSLAQSEAVRLKHSYVGTEHVLLGNLAIKAGVGNKVEWDGANLQVTNLKELNEFVGREYRPGWKVPAARA